MLLRMPNDVKAMLDVQCFPWRSKEFQRRHICATSVNQVPEIRLWRLGLKIINMIGMFGVFVYFRLVIASVLNVLYIDLYLRGDTCKFRREPPP